MSVSVSDAMDRILFSVHLVLAVSGLVVVSAAGGYAGNYFSGVTLLTVGVVVVGVLSLAGYNSLQSMDRSVNQAVRESND
jgi:uncharacterized membrane protein (Fun14 family)